MRSIVARVCVPCCALVLFSFAPVSAGAGAPPGDWKPLFNGKDLTGWSVAAGRGGANATPANWKVEDGVLVGGQGSGRGSLVTNDQFKDFTLELDRKSTRLNSSHPSISYAVFCLKKKNINNRI